MYNPPEFKHEIKLQLSRNESTCAIVDLEQQLSEQSDLVSRYPDHLPLQLLIAKSIGVADERVVVTAGGDDAIDRVLRTSINETRKKIVAHKPSFEMIDVYASQYGGQLDQTTWLGGDFPLEDFLGRIDAQTALVVVVTPNNPTGGVIPAEQILKIADAAKSAGAKLLVDNAYIEFADNDPTSELVSNNNLMIVRTFSKAWGLAGLRVGYLVAPDAETAASVRNASGPFPVSCVSLDTARRALTDYSDEMNTNVQRARSSREMIQQLMIECGATPYPSAGNFVLAKFQDAATASSIWEKLTEQGIGVRKFPDSDSLANMLRVTCPTSGGDMMNLARGFLQATESQFDLADIVNPLLASSTSAETTTSDSTAAQLRTATSNRKTKETDIEIELNLDGTGKTEIQTGVGFLDHMLTALAFHSKMDLKLVCNGDLRIDDHHTSEDCALALGTAIDQALGPRTGIKRFGYAYAPLDEALARTVIDLSGRPWPEVHLGLEREMVGQWACENIVHFFQSFAMTLKCSLHVDVIRGTNDHHRAEAAFKSLAQALQQALTKTAGDVPSTKGVL